MLNRNLTQLQRELVARQEYQILTPGQKIIINDHEFGIVLDHLYTQDGLQIYVIADHNYHPQEITLLFKGSSGLWKGNPDTWTNEWLNTNFPILWAMLFRKGELPQQLRSAAVTLNRILRKHQGCRVYIYGHSLGAINIQYALSHCQYIGMVKRVDIYEGPNIYLLLNNKERKHIRRFKHKINNYIDVYDPVVLGYYDQRHMVGRLQYVDSSPLPPITQHMWGGYEYYRNGNLKTRKIDKAFKKRAVRDQQMMENGRKLFDSFQTPVRPSIAESIQSFLEKLRQIELPTLPEGKLQPTNKGFDTIAFRKWLKQVVE